MEPLLLLKEDVVPTYTPTLPNCRGMHLPHDIGAGTHSASWAGQHNGQGNEHNARASLSLVPAQLE